jgi:hypothetical protein
LLKNSAVGLFTAVERPAPDMPVMITNGRRAVAAEGEGSDVGLSGMATIDAIMRP